MTSQVQATSQTTVQVRGGERVSPIVCDGSGDAPSLVVRIRCRLAAPMPQYPREMGLRAGHAVTETTRVGAGRRAFAMA